MLLFVEDVGRHNAIDTIAGWMWMREATDASRCPPAHFRGRVRRAARLLHDRPPHQRDGHQVGADGRGHRGFAQRHHADGPRDRAEAWACAPSAAPPTSTSSATPARSGCSCSPNWPAPGIRDGARCACCNTRRPPFPVGMVCRRPARRGVPETPRRRARARRRCRCCSLRCWCWAMEVALSRLEVAGPARLDVQAWLSGWWTAGSSWAWLVGFPSGHRCRAGQ
jgi:hypothetical protein